MSIFSRLSDIVNSNISAILEKAEEPERVIRQMIQEMEDTLVDLRTSAARLMANRKMLGKNNGGQSFARRLAQLEEAQAEWQRRAELALTKGREDLARGALIEKGKLARATDRVQQEVAAIDDDLHALEKDIENLQRKLHEARSKQKLLRDREKTVSSRLRARETLREGALDDFLRSMEELLHNTDRKEASLEAAEMGKEPTLEEEFADLEAGDDVEDELSALKDSLEKPAAKGAKGADGQGARKRKPRTSKGKDKQ